MTIAHAKLKEETVRIEFDREDFQVLDIALGHAPELRLCAGILKTARAAKLKYPVTCWSDLAKLMPMKQVFVEGHWLNHVLISRYMPKEFFPISDEHELVRSCYIGLIRCKEDMSWAQRAPEHATTVLEEFADIVAMKGEK